MFFQCNLRLPNLHLPLRRLPTSLGGIKSWLGAKEEARNAPFPTTHCTTTQGNSSLSRGVVSRGDNLASTTSPPGPRTDTWPKPTTTRSQTTWWPQPQTGVSMAAGVIHSLTRCFSSLPRQKLLIYLYRLDKLLIFGSL